MGLEIKSNYEYVSIDLVVLDRPLPFIYIGWGSRTSLL